MRKCAHRRRHTDGLASLLASESDGAHSAVRWLRSAPPYRRGTHEADCRLPRIHTIGLECPSVVVAIAEPRPLRPPHHAVFIFGGEPPEIFRTVNPLPLLGPEHFVPGA